MSADIHVVCSMCARGTRICFRLYCDMLNDPGYFSKLFIVYDIACVSENICEYVREYYVYARAYAYFLSFCCCCFFVNKG